MEEALQHIRSIQAAESMRNIPGKVREPAVDTEPRKHAERQGAAKKINKGEQQGGK